jgi:iron-sulfur cluster insertion protein
MIQIATSIAPRMIFTDAAAEKVKRLIQEEKNPFDEAINDGDIVIDNAGVSLVIDPMSYQYLIGAEVDYTEGLEGAQFVVRNPNATTTCGCGSSFSV